MPNVIGEVQNETADVRDSVWNIPDETKNVPNDVLDIPDLESDLPEEVLNVRDLIANVPNEVWKERLRLGLDQDFFERFAHGEMQGFPGWNIHDPASFRIFGRPWPAGADGEAAEAPDFHPAPVGVHAGIGRGGAGSRGRQIVQAGGRLRGKGNGARDHRLGRRA